MKMDLFVNSIFLIHYSIMRLINYIYSLLQYIYMLYLLYPPKVKSL